MNESVILDAKKIFVEFVLRNYVLPPIYIDEYWNYYIDEYNLKNTWENFLKTFQEDGLTYHKFLDEYFRIINEVKKIILNTSFENFLDKCKEVSSSISDTKIPKLNIWEFPDGEYLQVDIHNAFDEVLKYLGVFNPNYETVYEIVNSITDYKIFHNSKYMKLKIYAAIFLSREYLFQITNDILVERVYQSENPKLKEFTKTLTLAGKPHGDSYLYNLNDPVPPEVLNDYECGNIKYHIEKCEMKSVTIFGNICKCFIVKDKDDRIMNIYLYGNNHKLSFATYPFALKLALGKELNEKDLAIGWGDQIFFHFNKSEIV